MKKTFNVIYSNIFCDNPITSKHRETQNHHVCPRLGNPRMKKPSMTNARRHARVKYNMSTLSRQNLYKKRSRYSYFPICKYNERLTIAGRCIAKRRILTKMDNKRINWRFAGTANKGYPFDSLLRQIAETADF